MSSSAFVSAAADLNAVMSILDTPSSARSLLAAGLPHLGGAGRHALQAELGAAVRCELMDMHSEAKEASAVAGQKAEETDASLQELRARCKEAELEQGKASAEKTLRETALAEARKAVSDSEREHEEVDRVYKRELQKVEKLREEHSRATGIADGSLKMLIDGGWEDQDVKAAAISAVQEFLGHIKAEPALTAAAGQALACKDRQPFDCMVVDHISEVIATKINEITTSLRREEEHVSAFEAEALGFWALADVTRDRERDAARDLSQAEVCVFEATRVKKEATSDLSAREQTLTNFLAEQTLAGDRAENIEKALHALERILADNYAPDPSDAAAPVAESTQAEMPPSECPASAGDAGGDKMQC